MMARTLPGRARKSISDGISDSRRYWGCTSIERQPLEQSNRSDKIMGVKIRREVRSLDSVKVPQVNYLDYRPLLP